jgi:hypothetical protein
MNSQDNLVLGGYNNKHFDDWILMTMLNGGSNIEVKKHNDFIIKEKRNAWEYPFIQYQKKPFKSFDLKDDLPQDLSLKAIEGNLKLPIVESSISFDIDRKLTPEELEEVIRYCKYDVDSTVRLYGERKDYIDSKITVATLKNLDISEAMGLTNAKLGATYLEAKGNAPTNDERDYKLPPNLKTERIPREILDFFAQLQDKSIPDEVLFKKKLNILINGVEYVYGFGGVHASPRNYIKEV